ncbi:MAG: type II toxin-antitoxin system RelE/ParE family toxin [Chloroflexota bacterium]|nr:type II toxin-antitoxin system RelE/ParE family toxin [Chloroflexota bacterium]
MTSNIELRVSPEAERNIDDILQYTLKTWGNGQAMTYYTLLWNAFRRVQAFPEIGRRATENRPEVRELVLEYHTIVYRYRDNTVTILRIVNPRRGRRWSTTRE